MVRLVSLLSDDTWARGLLTPVEGRGFAGHRCPVDWLDGNLVWRVDDAVPEIFAAIEAAYPTGRSRILAPLVDPAAEPILAHRGWTVLPGKAMRMDVPVRLPEPRRRVEVVRDRAGVEAWYGVRLAVGKDPGPPSDALVAATLRLVAGPDARVVLVVVRDDAGAAVASGGLTLHPAHAAAYVWAGCTVPSARGRGAWRAGLSARLRLAEARGARRLWVIGQAHNTVGPLRALGFHDDDPWLNAMRSAPGSR